MMLRHIGMAVSVLGMSACAVPPAGIFYFDRTSVGVQIGAGETSGSPLNLSVGYSNLRGTYLPVAVEKHLEVVLATNSDPGQRALASRSTTSETDVFSIFSSFQLSATGGTGSVGTSFGNLFATGFAARTAAMAHSGIVCLEIAKEIEKNTGAKKDLQDVFKKHCQ